MNGRKSISTPYFSAMSKYGDFSEVGFGWETRTFFIFNVLKLKKEVIDVGKHTNQIKNKETNIEKIVIPTKRVIEQKNALQLILNRIFDGDIVCEKTYSWLKTPDQIKGIYKNLYDAISSYRGDTTFAKRNVSLRCDFVCESQKLIIEYDERAQCRRRRADNL